MRHDGNVVPRQIYASTVTRRDRRWTRRRGRARARGVLGIALVGAATLVAALGVVAAIAPGLS